MQKFNLKLLAGIAAVAMATLAVSCAKKDYRPGYDKGTTFPKLILKGYTISELRVKVGPDTVLARTVNEIIGAEAVEVPFSAAQQSNAVIFTTKEGKWLPGSSIDFNTPTKDTTISIFYDGRKLVKNPVFPAPTAGKMGMRIAFKSSVSSYTGPVDIEVHEQFNYDIRVPVIDPLTGKQKLDSRGRPVFETRTLIGIRPKITALFRNIKSTEFSNVLELPNGEVDGFYTYAFYVYQAGTQTPLPYPAGVTTTYGSLDGFLPDYTAIYTIREQGVADTTSTNVKYSYVAEDQRPQF